MDNLCIVNICADTEGVVCIDNALVGATSSREISVYYPQRQTAFSFFPICGPFLPVCRMIDLSCDPPEIACNDGCLTLIRTGNGGEYLLCVHPPQMDQRGREIPHILAQRSFSGPGWHADASVYYDGGYIASVRSGTAVAAVPFHASLRDAHLDAVYSGSGLTVLAAGEGEDSGMELAVFAASDSDVKELFHVCAAGYTLSGGILRMDCLPAHPCGFAIRRELRGQAAVPLSIVPAEDTGVAMPGCALALALKEGCGQTAYALLHPSLQADISIEDVAEFFGDFSDIYPPLCTPKRLCLLYPLSEHYAYMKSFSIALRGGLIANIDEAE